MVKVWIAKDNFNSETGFLYEGTTSAKVYWKEPSYSNLFYCMVPISEIEKEIAEKEKRIERLREALRFYAVASHYIESIETDETGVIFEGIKVAKDCGDIARAALQEETK